MASTAAPEATVVREALAVCRRGSEWTGAEATAVLAARAATAATAATLPSPGLSGATAATAATGATAATQEPGAMVASAATLVP
jgi:hypothetical protein